MRGLTYDSGFKKGASVKIFITGASGFVGKHVLKFLAQYHPDIAITALTRDRTKTARADGFASADGSARAGDSDSVTYVYGDVFSPSEGIINIASSADKIIHLAWGELNNFKSTGHLDKELPGHFEFLQACVEAGAKDISVTGTCFEYGLCDGVISETAPTEPVTAYGSAKNELLDRMQALQSEKAFQLKWLRLFYMYGEGQNPKSLLASLLQAIDSGDTVFNMSKGDQTRDYLPIEKVAEYIVLVARQNQVEGVINCCSGQAISVKSLVESTLQQRGAQLNLNLGHYPYPDYEGMHFWGDNTKLRSVKGVN